MEWFFKPGRSPGNKENYEDISRSKKERELGFGEGKGFIEHQEKMPSTFNRQVICIY